MQDNADSTARQGGAFILYTTTKVAAVFAATHSIIQLLFKCNFFLHWSELIKSKFVCKLTYCLKIIF